MHKSEVVRFVVPPSVRQRIRAAAAASDVRVGAELSAVLTSTYADPTIRPALRVSEEGVPRARDAAELRVQLDGATMTAVEAAAQAAGWSVRQEIRATVCALYSGEE